MIYKNKVLPLSIQMINIKDGNCFVFLLDYFLQDVYNQKINVTIQVYSEKDGIFRV